jgi:hypothetical protein
MKGTVWLINRVKYCLKVGFGGFCFTSLLSLFPSIFFTSFSIASSGALKKRRSHQTNKIKKKCQQRRKKLALDESVLKNGDEQSENLQPGSFDDLKNHSKTFVEIPRLIDSKIPLHIRD